MKRGTFLQTMRQCGLFLVVLVSVCGQANMQVFADSFTCPDGMSQLDCNALNGNWTSWVPDADNCGAGTTDGSAPDTTGAIATGTLSTLQVAFAQKYHDIAQNLSIQYGIPWEEVIAQGILESASGTSHFALTRNNFFGIGAVDSNVEAAASFPTPEAGFKGYYDFISGNSRYAAHGAFKEPAITDPIAYLKDIKAAGYATSADYVKNVGAVVKGVQELATTKSWESSAQLATSHPEMLTNAAKYASGSGASSVSSDTSDTSTSTSCAASTVADMSTPSSLGVGKGDFKDTGEVAGFANVLANAQKVNHYFGSKLVGKENCSFIVAISWKGANDPHIGFSGGADHIWYDHKNVGHADRNIKKGAILLYKTPAHVAIYLGNNKILNDGQITDANYVEDSWHATYLGWIDPNDIGFPPSNAASEADLAKWLTPYEVKNPNYSG